MGFFSIISLSCVRLLRDITRVKRRVSCCVLSAWTILKHSSTFFGFFMNTIKRVRTRPEGLKLIEWGRVTHICVGNLTPIASDSGLSPGRHHAIIWNNTWILLIGHLGTNFSVISIEMQTFPFKKMRLKVSSAKFLPFCLGFSVIIGTRQRRMWISICRMSHRVLSLTPVMFFVWLDYCINKRVCRIVRRIRFGIHLQSSGQYIGQGHHPRTSLLVYWNVTQLFYLYYLQIVIRPLLNKV